MARSVEVSVYMPRHMADRIEHEAFEANMSVSEYVREQLQKEEAES